MPLTLAQIRAQIRNATGHDTVTLPDADSGEVIGVDTYINTAWWHLIDKLHLRNQEQTTTNPTVDGTEFYTLPGSTIEAVRKMSFIDPDTNRVVYLDQKDMNFYRQNKDNNEFMRGKPLYYIRERNGYYLMPIPDDVYTIDIDHLSILTDYTLSSADIPRETGEIVKYGAVWRILSEVNGALNKASWYKMLCEDMIKQYKPVKEKEEDNNPHAGLNYIGREY